MTVTQAARLLGLQPHTAYDLIERGELRAEQVPARPGHRAYLRVQRQAVDEYLARARIRPGSLRHLYL